MKSIHKLIAEHTPFLKNYRYAYISSTALFLLLPGYKGTPSDFDIALDWSGKTKKELLELVGKIKHQAGVTKLCFKAIENQTTPKYSVQKNQIIGINSPIVADLLHQGNIKLTYFYKTMPVELFPEQEGNGVTNIDVCTPFIRNILLEGTNVSVLDIIEVAKRYVINFIDEIAHKKLDTINNPDYKHKDALRLNTIIQILHICKKDISPQGILSFIDKYIQDLKRSIPFPQRSIFIKGIIANYPKVYKKLLYITKLYSKLSDEQLAGTQEVDFSKFHEELKKELINIYELISLYQDNTLHTSYVKKTNILKRIQQIEIQKIQEYIQKINLTNKINGFAYFYEVYSIIYMIKQYK